MDRILIASVHNVVFAHQFSTIGVQAAGARRLLERAPESASDALHTIEGSSRSAVSEMHQLVGLLRSYETNGHGDRAPQPGIDDLEQIVADLPRGRVTAALR